jgi:hypothetical protein
MRTDGVFKTKQVLFPEWKAGKTMTLVPFGDIHRDSPGFSEAAWEKFLTRAKLLARKGDVLFLGMGDYLDSYSTSERMVMYGGGLHESSVKNHALTAQRKVESLAKELSFMRGKLIGFIGGNHFPILKGGISGDQHLAAMLETDYLGACCAIRITFRVHGNCRTSVDLFVHHGKGGGTTAAGKFNAVDKLQQVCDADIFLMGDNHARGCFPAGEKLRLCDSNGRLYVKAKPSWIGRTGSFLRAYVEDEPSYVVDAALQPSNLGHIEFLITPTRDCSGGRDVGGIDIGAIQ